MSLPSAPDRGSSTVAKSARERYARELDAADPDLASLIRRMPLLEQPPLEPTWLRCEMLERARVLQHAPMAPGLRVLEVGSGPHAIATLPLALRLGATGSVVAAERSRWGRFAELVAASGLGARIRPVMCDARRLPLRDGAVDLAVCLHGIRSLETEATMVGVFAEMLRVAPRVFLAESLPIAGTPAQRAHLDLYGLRAEVFQASTGRRDDLPYLPLERLGALVEQAGGVVSRSASLEVDLPHALAYFRRALIEELPDGPARTSLLHRWDSANVARERFGTDHPPVGLLEARRP